MVKSSVFSSAKKILELKLAVVENVDPSVFASGKRKKKICCRPSWSTRSSSLVKMIIKYELDQRKKNNKRKISSSQIHYFRGCECGVRTGDLF